MRNIRLLPVVVLAIAALLVFKTLGLVTNGGYVLTGVRVAQASGASAGGEGGATTEADATLTLPEEPTLEDTSPTLADEAPTIGQAAETGGGHGAPAAEAPAEAGAPAAEGEHPPAEGEHAPRPPPRPKAPAPSAPSPMRRSRQMAALSSTRHLLRPMPAPGTVRRPPKAKLRPKQKRQPKVTVNPPRPSLLPPISACPALPHPWPIACPRVTQFRCKSTARAAPRRWLVRTVHR